jgi:hypothetical protein
MKLLSWNILHGGGARASRLAEESLAVLGGCGCQGLPTLLQTVQPLTKMFEFRLQCLFYFR